MAEPPAHEIDDGTIYRATIHTDRGTIVMELDPQMAPQSVNNFVSLAAAAATTTGSRSTGSCPSS